MATWSCELQTVLTVDSIVAVHGLHEDAHGTWTEPANGTLWLRDLFPHQAQNARIMAYSYPSQKLTSSDEGNANQVYATNLVQSSVPTGRTAMEMHGRSSLSVTDLVGCWSREHWCMLQKANREGLNTCGQFTSLHTPSSSSGVLIMATTKLSCLRLRTLQPMSTGHFGMSCQKTPLS